MFIKTATTLLIMTVAFSGPAFAFGPAGMGRDLSHAAIFQQNASELDYMSTGFVKPNRLANLIDQDEAVTSEWGPACQSWNVIVDIAFFGGFYRHLLAPKRESTGCTYR